MAKRPAPVIQLTNKLGIDLTDPSVIQDGIRFWVTGESGSGKSTTCMLIAEQWMSFGQLIVLDAHGEYGELWSKLMGKVVRIGYGDKPVTVDSVDWLMSLVKEGLHLLIDLSHWTDINIDPLVGTKKEPGFIPKFMTALYEYQRQNSKPRLVVVEEAHSFVPQIQSENTMTSIRLFTGMLTGGRKYGLNFLLASQRQSLVDANVVSQCNVRLFMRVSDTGDWKKIKPHLPEKFPVMFGGGGKKDIKRFDSGEAVLVSRWFDPQRIRLNLPEVDVTKFIKMDEAS